MTAAPAVSVVIRVKDEAGSVARNIRLLGEQTIAASAETIVVDSGSTDGTVDTVREAGIDPIEIPAESFTYGHALNLGCERASAPVIVALSAHAFPTDERWLERMVAAFDDERVACACGLDHGPDGATLAATIVQDEPLARSNPFWGYSNSSGGFRAELWRAHPFREDMPGSEDKEWAWHWIQRGHVAVIDPALATDHDHSDEWLREKYRRFQRDWAGLGQFLELPPYRPRDLMSEWWSDRAGRRSAFRARVSPRRLAELAGTYSGRNHDRRRRA
jgi:rhamnosyltransferase